MAWEEGGQSLANMIIAEMPSSLNCQKLTERFKRSPAMAASSSGVGVPDIVDLRDSDDEEVVFAGSSSPRAGGGAPPLASASSCRHCAAPAPCPTAAACAAAYCGARLACGHACGGAPGEGAAHPPCLELACGGPDGRELCGACLTEPLRAEPVARIAQCGHTFHLACLLAIVAMRWDGPRVTFGRVACPTCRGPLDSPAPALRAALAPLQRLREELGRMARARIAVEGLWPPPAGSPAALELAAAEQRGGGGGASGGGGGGAGSSSSSSSSSSSGGGGGVAESDAVLAVRTAYAMAKLAYYICRSPTCGKPYFAGLASCEAAGGGEDDAAAASSSSAAAASSSSAGAAGSGAPGGGAAGGGAAGGGAGGAAIAGHKRRRSGGGAAAGAPPLAPPPGSAAAAAAAATAAAAAAAALLCPQCRGPPAGMPTLCVLHGSDPELVAMKCKYCCSTATHTCR